MQAEAQNSCSVDGECADLERFEDFIRQLVWGPRRQLMDTLLVLRNCELHEQSHHAPPQGAVKSCRRRGAECVSEERS